MVEQERKLDLLFGSLADPTRRDILKRVAVAEMSVSDIAQYYDLTFAAVSKHLMMLEKAKLITKRRWGKQRMVQLEPSAIKDVAVYLKHYEKLWNKRLDSLEHYLTTIQ